MDSAEKVEWLYQRALISDVLYRFAYYLDTRKWQEWIGLFADDGVLVLPNETKNKAMLTADGGPRGLLALHATHHISSNHRIEIDGDTARSNSYLQAMHIIDPADENARWAVGGWYDNEYRRTGRDWQITRAQVVAKWAWDPRPPGMQAPTAANDARPVAKNY